jgi:hypothetical protein
VKKDAVLDTPDQLRRILHEHIDTLPAVELPLVHRILLQLEAERLMEAIADDLVKDPKFFERIEETIAQFRKEHPYRA